MQLIDSLKHFFREVTDIRPSIDTVKAAENIRSNIYFK